MALAVIALVGLAFVGESGVQQHLRLRRELARYQARNRDLMAENRRLERRVHALRHDQQALRAAIRDELGWVAPHETVVLFRGSGEP